MIYKNYTNYICIHLEVSKYYSTFVITKVTFMNTRLKQFIAAENITQAQLADKLNVVRASVSHILAGRNKPGYDFIYALMNHYPNLNIEWLMFGKGKMYKTAENDHEYGSLFTETALPEPHQPELHVPEQPVQVQIEPRIEPGVTLNDIKTLVSSMQKPINQRKLIKITAFFDDGTFQELTTI